MQGGTFLSPGYPEDTAQPETAAPNLFARDCPTRQVLDRIGDKWSVLVLLLLGAAPRRFNALRRGIDGISQKMLSQTLRGLERDGLVRRVVVARVPVQVTYYLTPLGADLLEALRPMIGWAESRMADVLAARAAHAAGAGDAEPECVSAAPR